jgi:hypothetical protein
VGRWRHKGIDGRSTQQFECQWDEQQEESDKNEED